MRPWGRGGANSAWLQTQTPQASPQSPMRLEEEVLGSQGGQQGCWGAGGTPTGSGIVPGAAIQRNTGCQALPQQLWPCGDRPCSLARSWEGWGGPCGPKAQSLILDFKAGPPS